MKFYSYTTINHNYTKAVTLKDVRSVQRINGDGKSAIRYSVKIDYLNGSSENFSSLENEESMKVYQEIVNLLNKE